MGPNFRKLRWRARRRGRQHVVALREAEGVKAAREALVGLDALGKGFDGLVHVHQKAVDRVACLIVARWDTYSLDAERLACKRHHRLHARVEARVAHAVSHHDGQVPSRRRVCRCDVGQRKGRRDRGQRRFRKLRRERLGFGDRALDEREQQAHATPKALSRFAERGEIEGHQPGLWSSHR